MATYTADQAADGYPVTEHGGGILNAAYGTLELTDIANDDVWKFCKVPANSKVLFGFLRGDDLDTGTEELDVDIGWAANGVEAADPDGFGNLGVITGDAVTEWKPEVSIFMPLNGLLKDGPVSFSAETMIQGDVNADAATGEAGTIWLSLFYIVL